MRARPLIWSAAFVVVLSACGGAPSRSDVAAPARARAAAAVVTTTSTSTSTTTLAPAPVPSTTTAPTTTPAPPPAPIRRLLVVGDSIAQLTGEYLAAVAAPASVTVLNGGVWGCGVAEGGPMRYFGALTPQPGNCDGWADRWAALVRDGRPDATLVIAGRWEVMDRVHDGVWMQIGEPAYDAYLRAQLERAVVVLSAGGGRVVLATAPYYRRGLRPDGGLWPEDDPARVDRYNALVHEVAAAHPGVVSVVDLGERVTPGDRYVADVDGIRVRRDGVHLTEEGERWLAPWLFQQVVAPGG